MGDWVGGSSALRLNRLSPTRAKRLIGRGRDDLGDDLGDDRRPDGSGVNHLASLILALQ